MVRMPRPAAGAVRLVWNGIKNIGLQGHAGGDFEYRWGSDHWATPARLQKRPRGSGEPWTTVRAWNDDGGLDDVDDVDAARLELRRRYPPAHELLPEPRFDGSYSAPSRGWEIRFQSDRTLKANSDDGTWIALDGRVVCDFGQWHCDGVIGRSSLFLECVYVSLVGDAIDAEIAEFAFVEDED